MNPGKIIQLYSFQDILYCLTEHGDIYQFDPYKGTYTLVSKGL